MSGLLSLPEELLRTICSYLDDRDLKVLQSVCVKFSTTIDKRLFRRFRLTAEDLHGRTLHQVLHGYVNIRALTIGGGIRLTNANCARIAKELPWLNSLSLHFPAKISDGIQELFNVARHLSGLSSIDIRFEGSWNADDLMTPLRKFKKMERFWLIRRGNRSVDNTDLSRKTDQSEARRLDTNVFLARLAELENARWTDLRIDIQSYRDVRRLTLEGLAPLITLHHSTLTELHLRHLQFHPLRSSLHDATVHGLFSRLRALTRLSLTGVEGFSCDDWIRLFVHPDSHQMAELGPWEIRSPNRSRNDGVVGGCPVFPCLQHLHLDFVSNFVLVNLGHVYGGLLKTLHLSEYTKIFDQDDAEVNSESTCPKHFIRMLESFLALESLTLGIKVNTFDQRIRRIVGWLAKGDFESLDFSINITPL